MVENDKTPYSHEPSFACAAPIARIHSGANSANRLEYNIANWSRSLVIITRSTHDKC